MATEVSTSKQKKFSLVTFIDTPGLVDGDMKYPFDVNKAITWLGALLLQMGFLFRTMILFFFFFLVAFVLSLIHSMEFKRRQVKK